MNRRMNLHLRLKGSGITRVWHAERKRWATAREKQLGKQAPRAILGCLCKTKPKTVSFYYNKILHQVRFTELFLFSVKRGFAFEILCKGCLGTCGQSRVLWRVYGGLLFSPLTSCWKLMRWWGQVFSCLQLWLQLYAFSPQPSSMTISTAVSPRFRVLGRSTNWWGCRKMVAASVLACFSSWEAPRMWWPSGLRNWDL